MFDFLSKAGSSVMDGLSSVGSSVADGVQSGLAHTFEKLQDPEFMQQAGLMGAALSNDNNRYQSALNAYDSRRQEIARQKREDMQRAQQREQQIADRDEGRSYNEQQQYLAEFTPESVQAFRESGDPSVLVKKPVKMEFRREEGQDGHTYEVQIDPQTGLDVPDGVRRVVDYAEAKTADTGTWSISGGYKINNKTGEMVKLDGDEGNGNGEPAMRTTSGGKPIPVGYDEDGNMYYQSTNPEYVTDANGMPVLASSVGKLDPMDPTKRQALQTKVDKEEENYQAPAKASKDLATTARKIINHPNFDRAYGNWDANLPTVRQETKDVENLIEQLKGQTFLSMRGQLKGQGQITDYESQRAEAAMSIVTNRTSSAKAAREAYNELLELDKQIQDRISRGVDSQGNPVRHRRPRDPLAQTNNGLDRNQVQIRRN